MTQKKQHWARGLGDAVNMATTVAAAVGLGYFAGVWLDGKFGTDPWLTLLGFMVGVATGMKVMWDKAMAGTSTSSALNDNNRDKEQQDN